MAGDRAAAERDFRAKLSLEARLRREWRGVEKAVVRRVVANVARNLDLPDVEGLSRELAAPVLRAHYNQVVEEFSGSVEAGLPESSRLTAEEKAAIAAALALALAARSETQASAIAKTNAKDARVALTRARAESEQRATAARAAGAADAPGIGAMDRRELGIFAGIGLDRRLRGRTQAVVVLETQALAELTRFSEAMAIFGDTPAGVVARRVKEWITVGDDRVRPAHAAVDSDQVDADQPFRVMGEELMYPGDTSLGASAANVVNCRCSVSYDVESVASSRQR